MTEMSGLRERSKTRTRHEIVEAALDLFEKNGFDVQKALGKLGPKADLDFSGYTFDRAEFPTYLDRVIGPVS